MSLADIILSNRDSISANVLNKPSTMKKLFLLLVACSFSMAMCNPLFAAESASASSTTTTYSPTLDKTLAAIDKLIEGFKNNQLGNPEDINLDSVIAEIDNLMHIMTSDEELTQNHVDSLSTHIFALEGDDRLIAMSHLFTSLNKLDSNMGFTMERSKELIDLAHVWAQKFSDLPGMMVNQQEFDKVCNELTQDEASFLMAAVVVFGNELKEK